MLTTEELLRPRYKVIADFPGCSYEVDTVLYVDQSGELYSPTAGYSRTVTKVMQCDAEKYPAYIQPLPWWSDREISDMPEYVKLVIYGKNSFVHKVEGWVGNNAHGTPMYDFKNRVGYVSPRSVTDLLPATLADYDEYLQQKG